MALLGWMEEAGMDYAICHVNYHMRPTASRDEQIVRRFAFDHHRPLFILSCRADEVEGNFQAWAREKRYAFFEQCARALQADCLYLGHHEDDALETWIMQKEKKILPSVYGLNEYPISDFLQLKRPFLNKTKAELMDYCLRHEIPFGIDESNLTDHYHRNQIRHEQIENLSAQKRKELKAMMEEDNRKLEARRKHARDMAHEASFEKIQADPDGWMAIDVLFFLQTGNHLSRKEASEILDQLSSGRLIETKEVLFQKVGDVLRCEKKDILLPFYIENPLFLRAYASSQTSYGWVFVNNEGKAIERFSVNDDEFPLLIRPMEPGDEIEMRSFTKKINRLLIDRKIPAIDRMKLPVVVNNQGKVIFAALAGCDKDHFERKRVAYVHVKDLSHKPVFDAQHRKNRTGHQ